jgi:hypothetical protein
MAAVGINVTSVRRRSGCRRGRADPGAMGDQSCEAARREGSPCDHDPYKLWRRTRQTLGRPAKSASVIPGSPSCSPTGTEIAKLRLGHQHGHDCCMNGLVRLPTGSTTEAARNSLPGPASVDSVASVHAAGPKPENQR